MTEIIIDVKKYKTPLMIIYAGIKYWIKQATKSEGIYLNKQKPK